MKKRVLSILLTSVVIMGLLTGCSSKNNNQESNVTVKENGKTLVVYYSATGNTEKVATAISEATGGDKFELIPVEPYSDDDLDWTNDNSRVSVEHDNEKQRDVELKTTKVKNWDSYDTVFIGYPIWWGNAAWPVDNFVKTNDFTGKTVIPFCTSISSGFGESGELLKEMAKTGEWKEGERFQSSASADDVKEWVKGLGY
ncbi:flavodoxin [Lachnospiraceae bacterium KM106-2]|nr:flavodoxin [Lachnospiraceae bacterium KM106-2]